MAGPLFSKKPLIPVTEKEIAQFTEIETSTVPSSRSFLQRTAYEVPTRLSFDRLVENDLEYPCTKREFLDYLIYIEGSAENLQFWTWFRDYQGRFNTATNDHRSSPTPVPQHTSTTTTAIGSDPESSDDETNRHSSNAFEMRTQGPRKMVVSMVSNVSDPFNTPPCTPGVNFRAPELTPKASLRSLTAEEAQTLSDPENDDLQSFREEMDRVIATYVMNGARRQLNLSFQEQKALLGSLSYNTHPDTLTSIYSGVEVALRKHSYPTFVRWSRANCNFARLCALKAGGLLLVMLSLLFNLVLILSAAPRGWRAISVPGMLLGWIMVLCSKRGICFFLYLVRRHQVRPWEQFLDEEATGEKDRQSTTPFGPANNYDEDVWLTKYEDRGVLQKIMDQTEKVRELGMIREHTIVVGQSIGLAMIITAATIGMLIAVPGVELF